ncbi:MAG: transporter [Lentisphaerae bacterium]|nr:transporter [Lentisphaerota bacterium]
MKRKAFFSIVTGALVASAMAAGAFAGDWKADTFISYSSGDYGSTSEAEIWYVPLSLTRYFPRGSATLTVPFVSVDTGSTESGMGDILLKGRFYALLQEGMWPGVDLVAKVKVPTADENKGLGTGEFDEGAAVEVYRLFDRRFVAFFSVGYNFIGDPPGVDYSDQFVFDIGCSYVGHPPWSHTLFYDTYSRTAPGGDDIRAISYAIGYKLTPDWRLTGVIEKGLSDGAADYTLTAGIARYF